VDFEQKATEKRATVEGENLATKVQKIPDAHRPCDRKAQGRDGFVGNQDVRTLEAYRGCWDLD
jgi:hypothetical protein